MTPEFESANDPTPKQIPEVPRDAQSRVDWKKLNQNPSDLVRFVEDDAKQAIADGVEFTYQGLIKSGRGYLYSGLTRYYPGGFYGLRESLNLSADVKSKTFWHDPSTIIAEARKFLESEGSFSPKLLASRRRSDLAHAIARYYPGRMAGISADLGIPYKQKAPRSTIPRVRKGPTPTRWAELKESNPDEFLSSVKTKALDFYKQYGALSTYALSKNNLSGFGRAIEIHYPGGMGQLRTDLGIVLDRKPAGYWTVKNIEEEVKKILSDGGQFSHKYFRRIGRSDLSSVVDHVYPGGTYALRIALGLAETKKPSGYWTAETIKEAAANFISENEDINFELLKKQNPGLGSAIYKYYQGGMYQLRDDFGLERNSRPNGYWTPENIEKAALEFYEKEGVLSSKSLKKRGNSSLAPLISTFYPGGMNALKQKLGINLSVYPKGYWTADKIEEEIGQFTSEIPSISEKSLIDSGRNDLAYVVMHYYPGRFSALREKLGKPLEKPLTVWSEERIEKEAMEFFEAHGSLTHKILVEKKLSSLSSAIVTKYPGGYPALKQKLGIAFYPNREAVVDSHEANEQLRGLLKGGQNG